MFDGISELFKNTKNQFNSLTKKSKDFYKDNRKKFQNLYETNYNTGLYHLEHGNLWDATFRFRVVRIFWPDEIDPRYQYAVCLVLKEKNNEAEVILEDILKKNSNYKNAKDLLKKIQNRETEKMVAEFRAKSEKKPVAAKTAKGKKKK